MRLDVDLGTDVSLVPLAGPTFSSVVISPDGTRLVYVGSVSGGPPKLLTRRLDQPNATELPGTEGAMNPFFSRDGQWVGFWNGNAISKVPVDGGGAVLLGELSIMTGGDWDDDGNLVIGWRSILHWRAADALDGRRRRHPCWNWRAASCSTRTRRSCRAGRRCSSRRSATPPQPGQLHDRRRLPRRSPPQDTRARSRICLATCRAVISVYTNKATMFAVPFDLERLETRGTAVAVLDDVAYDPVANGAQFDVSRTGTLVYRQRSGSASSSATVQWLDPTGKQEPLLAKPGAYVGTPRVSPDGKRIAIAIKDGADQDIWVYEPQRDAMTRLTFGGRKVFESGVEPRRTVRCLRLVGQRHLLESR